MNIRKKCLNGFSLEQSLKEVILFEVSTLLFEKQFVWDFVSFCEFLCIFGFERKLCGKRRIFCD